jgi:hypothetical protein
MKSELIIFEGYKISCFYDEETDNEMSRINGIGRK